MSKYILTIIQNKIQNDGLSKPKKDINQILGRRGYRSIRLNRLEGKMSKLMNSSKAARNVVNKLNTQDILVVHYPTYMGTIFDRLLLQQARRKGIQMVAFIHDIDSLRFEMAWGRGLKYEVGTLNKYDYTIVPNHIMLSFLKKRGMNTKSVSLKLFDYLTENAELSVAKYSHVVSFAGNLNKAKFVSKLTNSKDITYRFYGPLDDKNTVKKGNYFGSFPSDTLLKKIDSGFGLIWDGPDETIGDNGNASFGNYLRYNNPYKLSFYVAAGIPIIIWKDAAEADFVIEHNLGLTIDNLSELPNVIANVSEKEYLNLVDSVEIVRRKVLQGGFTADAIDELNKLLESQNILSN